MKIIKEQSLREFKFWSGAVENSRKLTLEQLDKVEIIFEDLYPDGMDAGNLNNWFWFGFNQICEWLGIDITE